MNQTIADQTPDQLTLGIETSCDETSAAIYCSRQGLLSHTIFSQPQHRMHGGVMPEIGSRTQLEKINPIVQEALDIGKVTLNDVTNIAVTNRPGLPGSLLVGLCFAKALAWEKKKKLIGVNHLEGHAFSAFLQYPNIPFPHMCITASGGHTALYVIKGFGDYQMLGHTVDDAAGEAFDKIARLVGLPYPGGPEIEKRAREMNFKDFFGYPRTKKDTLNFSFSGLKTAVLYDLVKQGKFNLVQKQLLDDSEELKNQVASSFLVCVADIFEQKLERAFEEHPEIQALTFVGGVACNKYIKQRLADFAQRKGKEFFSPRAEFCTDNGAMIAFVGNYKALQGKFSDMSLDISTNKQQNP
jgi:N6-L-threonylcarbamoyladenine synthase